MNVTEIIELLRERAMVGRMEVRDKRLMIMAADALEGMRIEGEWLEEPFESMIPATFDEEGRLVIHQYIAYRCSICGRKEHIKEPYCNCGAKMKGCE